MIIPQVSIEQQQIDEMLEAAYLRFMRKKYPSKSPEKPRFGFFDPNDDVPDWARGLAFVSLSEEDLDYYLRIPKQKRSLMFALKVAKSMRKQPAVAGWWIDIGSSWLWLGETPDQVVARLDGALK
jgi:hypothetical protein